MPQLPEGQPGDSVISNPEMLYTHSIAIHATPSTIFPWILQVGKGRGGWYTPRSWEYVLPKKAHASRSVNEECTKLKAGDVVLDYGFDEKEDTFEVVEIKDPRRDVVKQGGPDGALVYKSERYGTVFSWALLVHDLGGESVDAARRREGWSEVTLRFRGRIQRTGWQRKMLVFGGGWMDWMTTWPMLRGLKERCEEEQKSR